MKKIDGKVIAQKIIERLSQKSVPDKILAGILIGKNPASQSFLKIKEKTAKSLGINFKVYEFPEKSSTKFLAEKIKAIAAQKKVGGVIIQLPLPKHVDSLAVLNVIPAEKDIDVLSERAVGSFYNGTNMINPPAVGVIEEIIKIKNYQLKDKIVAVVGLGFLIGKPVSLWMIRKCKELYLLDKGSDLSLLKQADLIISGTGQSSLIKPAMLKKGAMVIDFGYSFKNGKIFGDFDESKIVNCKLEIRNLLYTPTPGGTGPILVAKLMENFYRLSANTASGGRKKYTRARGGH